MTAYSLSLALVHSWYWQAIIYLWAIQTLLFATHAPTKTRTSMVRPVRADKLLRTLLQSDRKWTAPRLSLEPTELLCYRIWRCHKVTITLLSHMYLPPSGMIWSNTLTCRNTSPTSMLETVDYWLNASSCHRVVQELMLDAVKWPHQIMLFPSHKTSVQVILRLSVLNVRMSMVVKLIKTAGLLNKPRIVAKH